MKQPEAHRAAPGPFLHPKSNIKNLSSRGNIRSRIRRAYRSVPKRPGRASGKRCGADLL